MHSVVTADTIAAGQTLLSESIDAVLLDYDLSDGKGTKFATWAREHGRLAPIVAVSAHDDGNAALLDAGANVACSKGAFSRVASLLERVRPLPRPEATPRPAPARLAHTFIAAVDATDDVRHPFEELLAALLFGEKRAWDAFLQGLITHAEFRNLLLAHTHTLYEDLSRMPLPFVPTTLAVVPQFDSALFWRPGEAG